MNTKRSQAVRRAALRRASGSCEECSWPADLWISQYMAECGISRRKAIGAIAWDKGWGGVTSLLQVDHRVPLALGGKDEVGNTVVRCVACHRAKTAGHDVPLIAKSRRVRARQAAFLARLARKAGQ